MTPFALHRAAEGVAGPRRPGSAAHDKSAGRQITRRAGGLEKATTKRPWNCLLDSKSSLPDLWQAEKGGEVCRHTAIGGGGGGGRAGGKNAPISPLTSWWAASTPTTHARAACMVALTYAYARVSRAMPCPQHDVVLHSQQQHDVSIVLVLVVTMLSVQSYPLNRSAQRIF